MYFCLIDTANHIFIFALAISLEPCLHLLLILCTEFCDMILETTYSCYIVFPLHSFFCPGFFIICFKCMLLLYRTQLQRVIQLYLRTIGKQINIQMYQSNLLFVIGTLKTQFSSDFHCSPKYNHSLINPNLNISH